MTESIQFKDFTKKRKQVFFTVDGVRYDCYPAVSLPGLQAITASAKDGMDPEKAMASLELFFAEVMDAENADRLREKMADRKSPLDMEQAADIMMWLLEVYGLRPTPSSSDSSTGSPTDADGTPSEAGA